MNTYDYESLCQVMRKLRPWQINALAAACAEKVIPIVYYLSTPSTRELARESLDFMWSRLEPSDSDRTEATKLKESLENTPEWQCEDLDSIQSIVASALNFFVWGLESVHDDSVSEEGEQVGFSHLLTIAGLFDAAIQAFKSQLPRVTGIERSEEGSQERLVGIVQTENEPSDKLIAVVKKETATVAKLLEKHLPVLCFDYLSDCVDQ